MLIINHNKTALTLHDVHVKSLITYIFDVISPTCHMECGHLKLSLMCSIKFISEVQDNFGNVYSLWFIQHCSLSQAFQALLESREGLKYVSDT